MVFKFIKSLSGGITLAEILVVIFIIAVILMILVPDFPKIQRQFALSRATYKFAQDLRRVQNIALSGVKINSLDIAGYGVFVDIRNQPVKEYIIYIDIKQNGLGNNQYDPLTDHIIETIDLTKDAPGVIIRGFNLIDNNYVSINFNPPNPTTSISNLAIINGAESNRAGIIFSLESDPINSTNTRTVYIWKSGLIEAR